MPIQKVINHKRVPVKIWTDDIDDRFKEQLANIAKPSRGGEMSLPFYSFNCTLCNLDRRFFFDTAYEFVDASGDGYAPSLQAFWCEDCDKVVTSIHPQTEASIAGEVELRSEWIAAEQSRKRGLFQPFRKPDEALIEKWRSEIAQLKLSVEFFRSKGMVPRCLICCGTNVTHIELPDSDAGNASVGVRHHCGGEIHGAIAGQIRFGELAVVTYNIEGRILSDGRECATDKALDQDSLHAVIGVSGNVGSHLLDAAQLSENIERVVHPEFSVLGVYLSVREFLAVTERGGNAVDISARILTSPPYLKADLALNKGDLDRFKHSVLDALRKYDREANRGFGDGPAPWGNSKESQEFGRNAFQILFERLSAYPELESTPFSLNIEGIKSEIAKQPEALSTAFHELLKAEAI